MDMISLMFVAIGLAMDAFSVAVTDGMLVKKVRLKNALTVGLFFGGFQFVMPCIGWLLGTLLGDLIKAYDHWIAFILLALIGGKMIWDAKFGEQEMPKNPLQWKTLTVLAIATSIDALAAGVTFAAMNVSLLLCAGVIGITAFLFSFTGIYIGKRFGDFLGTKAGVFGGILLIAMGLKTLLEHLF